MNEHVSNTVGETVGKAFPAALRFTDFRLTLSGESGPLLVLNRVIAPGSCLAIMGASGRGKSTILKAIAGFAPGWAKSSGRIDINGTRIDTLPAEQRQLGLLLQDDLLFPHLTIGGNLLFGLAARHKGGPARRKLVEEALARAGLAGMFDRPPNALSGGQRSRVALLRTLLSEPRALLLDEPFSKLDATTRASIRHYVFGEARARGLPMLLVTHDKRDAEAAEAEILYLPDLPES